MEWSTAENGWQGSRYGRGGEHDDGGSIQPLPFRSIILPSPPPPLFLSLCLSDWVAQNETKSFQEILHARKHKWAATVCSVLPCLNCLPACLPGCFKRLEINPELGWGRCQVIFRFGMHAICEKLLRASFATKA